MMYSPQLRPARGNKIATLTLNWDAPEPILVGDDDLGVLRLVQVISASVLFARPERLRVRGDRPARLWGEP
jgi:hypothetical protein